MWVHRTAIDRRFDSSTWTIVGVLSVGLTAGLSSEAAAATPFKVAKIYFETNASACDMGIQIAFDTDGISAGTVKDPDGRVIYEITARNGLRGIGGQTEGFLESAEPVVTN